MSMLLSRRPRERIFLARGSLVLLILGMLLTGPRIFPCLHCDWDGHQRLSGMPSHVTCDKCCGKGFLTGVDAAMLLSGGKPTIEQAFVSVTTFEELPPG